VTNGEPKAFPVCYAEEIQNKQHLGNEPQKETAEKLHLVLSLINVFMLRCWILTV